MLGGIEYTSRWVGKPPSLAVDTALGATGAPLPCRIPKAPAVANWEVMNLLGGFRRNPIINWNNVD